MDFGSIIHLFGLVSRDKVCVLLVHASAEELPLREGQQTCRDYFRASFQITRPNPLSELLRLRRKLKTVFAWSVLRQRKRIFFRLGSMLLAQPIKLTHCDTSPIRFDVPNGFSCFP